jgi:midasin
MQTGNWVLLDELNLASQQVLEGLNACLDHRSSIYIPELDRHFSCHPEFRVFAAQNPHHQGGGRKGLPKSFVNRFTQVFIDALTTADHAYICCSLFPNIKEDIIHKIIAFNERVKHEIMDLNMFGFRGAPWEFNLRDILRWLTLIHEEKAHPCDFLNMLYVHRMRTKEDRQHLRNLFEELFAPIPQHVLHAPMYRVTENYLVIGSSTYRRKLPNNNNAACLELRPSNLSIVESLLKCVKTNAMPLLVGPTFSGKTSLVRLLASLCGETLVELSLTPAIDCLELLGGFEQVDANRREQELVDSLVKLSNRVSADLLSNDKISDFLLVNLARENLISSDSHNRLHFVTQLVELLENGEVANEVESLKLKFQRFLKVSSSGTQGQFEWLDSVLIRALEEGHWLLLDNVNLCSSSVLDRLNSLLEVGGSLSLNERGLVNGEVKIIYPHSNFRIFMAMDPSHGEISRAMRNRSIELFVEEFDLSEKAVSLNMIRTLSALGLPGMLFSKLFHHQSLRNNSSMPKVFLELLQRGIPCIEAASEMGFSLNHSEKLLPLFSSFSDHVDGSFLISNPTAANIVFDGSIMFHLLSDEHPYFFTDTEKQLASSSYNRLFFSLCLFFDSANLSDISIRFKYVEYISQYCYDIGTTKLIGDLISAFRLVRRETTLGTFQLKEQILLESGFDTLHAREMVLYF